MNIKRLFRHLFYPSWWLRRDFPPAILSEIEGLIATSESTHTGEIRFAIESSLPLRALWWDEPVQERSIEVFSLLRVWDTEDNNGVLIYLLLADRRVEITVDRNIAKRVDTETLRLICQCMEKQFQQRNFKAGVVEGIEAVTKHLVQHFPYQNGDKDELSNKPVIL